MVCGNLARRGCNRGREPREEEVNGAGMVSGGPTKERAMKNIGKIAALVLFTAGFAGEALAADAAANGSMSNSSSMSGSMSGSMDHGKMKDKDKNKNKTKSAGAMSGSMSGSASAGAMSGSMSGSAGH
jgi:hypothetical protein